MPEGERDHKQLHDWLGAYAIGGLEPEESRAVRRHLETCEACRFELQQLEGLHELLEASALAEEPPPHLEERVIRAVASALERGQTPSPAHDSTAGTSPLQARRRWNPAVVSSAAAAAVIMLLLAIAVQRQLLQGERVPGQSRSEVASLPGAEAPTASFRLVASGPPQETPVASRSPDSAAVATGASPALPRGSGGSYVGLPGGELVPRKAPAGWQCEITVWGLQAGQLYEVWFRTSRGVISGGSFRPASPGMLTLNVYTGVPFTEVSEILITAEPDDGDPMPAGPVVLRTSLRNEPGVPAR